MLQRWNWVPYEITDHNSCLHVFHTIGMLEDASVIKKDAAVKCLEVMSNADDFQWHAVLDAGGLYTAITPQSSNNTGVCYGATSGSYNVVCTGATLFRLLRPGGIAALVKLLSLGNEDIQSVTLAVLCNISTHQPIRHALTSAKAGPILINLLTSPVDDIQSRAAVVLSDLACVDDNQTSIMEQGGVPAIINLLDSEVEDVLVNAVNAVRVMCEGSLTNQTAFAREGVIEPLVEFLTLEPGINRRTFLMSDI